MSDFTDFQVVMNCLGNDMMVIKSYLDFSKYNKAAVAVPIATAPLGFHGLGTSFEVITEEGGVCTGDIGDAADANGWDDAVDLNAAGVYLSKPADPYPTLGGKAFTAETPILLTLDNAADTAVCSFNMYGYFYKWVN